MPKKLWKGKQKQESKLMPALLLLNSSSIMLKGNLWSRRLYVKNVERFSKLTATLNYVLTVKKKENKYFSVDYDHKKFKDLRVINYTRKGDKW
ncbi:hypothetical protein DSECCO2_140360 [anaerobic digester metagenome]